MLLVALTLNIKVMEIKAKLYQLKNILIRLNHIKTQSKWKIQLATPISCFSSRDYEETCTMHTKSGNIESLIGNKRDYIFDELFDSLLQRYQKGLEELIKGSEFNFNGVDLLHYKCHKINLAQGGSYIDYRKWLKNKIATVNPKNNYEKCFQYGLTVALHHQDIKYNPERI